MKRSILIVLLLLVGATALHAQETTPMPTAPSDGLTNTITVTGTGTAYGQPEIAYLELGVENTDPALDAAFTATAESMNAVFEALRELGIADEDLQTSGVNVFVEDRFPENGGTETQRVYHVRNTVRVTIRDISLIENVITTAVSSGANTIYNLSFGIEDTEALEQEARVAAVENARNRAQSLADILGVTVGRPVIISETFGNVSPLAFGRGGGVMNLDVATPVSPGQLSVDVQVQITFAIEG